MSPITDPAAGRSMPEHFDPGGLANFKEIAPVFDKIFDKHR